MTFTLGWAQLLYLTIAFLGLVASAAYHGHQTRIDFWVRAVQSAFLLFVLWAGGFFK